MYLAEFCHDVFSILIPKHVVYIALIPFVINRKEDIERILSGKAFHVKILSKVEDIGPFFLHPCYFTKAADDN